MTTAEVANKLTPAREAMNLYHHGTEKWALTPNIVLETAKQDLRSRAYNARLTIDEQDYETRGLPTKGLGPRRKYGFSPVHVNRADTALELLEIALKDRAEGTTSQDVRTYALYDNVTVLTGALALAKAEDGA
jgi:hypothetical protein